MLECECFSIVQLCTNTNVPSSSGADVQFSSVCVSQANVATPFSYICQIFLDCFVVDVFLAVIYFATVL